MSQTELIASEQKKLDALVEKLKYFKNQLEYTDYTHNQKKFMDIAKQLSTYVCSIRDQDLIEMFFHSKYYTDFQSFFHDQLAYYWRALEASESLGIMTKGEHNHIGFEHVLQDDLIKDKYINKEGAFSVIDMSNKRKIVCVGCGSMPETMIYLYEHYKPDEIIGIDNNFEAVYIANQLISHLGVTNIKVIHADGVNYDYSGVDLVYVAALVSPKDEVISRIIETTDDNIEIIAMLPRFLGYLIIDDITIEKHPRLRMKDLYIEGDLTRSSKKSVLLTKYNY